MAKTKSNEFALTVEEFVRLLMSFNDLPEAMFSTLYAAASADRAQFEPQLPVLGALVYAKREPIRARGWYVPERFFAKAPSPVAPPKAKSRSVSDYSHDELVAIIRPAYEAFLAAGGAAG